MEVSAAADLPRSQAGANPQRVLAALLGDYWLDRPEYLPSAALVDLLAEFDITSASARAALSRLLRRGTLDVRKVGRTTRYRLSDTARDQLAAAADTLFASARRHHPAWDGGWTVLAFSVSEDRREARHALRSGLRRLGFVPMYDGVWASPHPDDGELARLLDHLGIEQATVLRARVLHPKDGAAGHPGAGWDLEALHRGWTAFTADHRLLLASLYEGGVDPQQALRARLAVLDRWGALVESEPSLPAELLPEHWPRERAAQLFVDVLDRLAPLAETRFRQLVARYAPELAPLARVRRSAPFGAAPGSPAGTADEPRGALVGIR